MIVPFSESNRSVWELSVFHTPVCKKKSYEINLQNNVTYYKHDFLTCKHKLTLDGLICY